MMFYVIDMNEIENEKIKKWYMKNYQEKGIHTLDIENEKYIWSFKKIPENVPRY